MQESLNNKTSLKAAAMAEASSINICYESGDISIRPELGQVMVAGQTARLTPVNMKVLVSLLKRPGEVVSRNEIYQQVWSNQIVSDDTLTRAISDIRAMFKSLAIDLKLIETIPKKGYRWLASCESINQPIEASDPSITEQPAHRHLHENGGVNVKVIKNESQLSRQNIATAPNWLKWLLWSLGALALFSLLVTSIVWLVKGQFNQGYIKVAMMPVNYQTDTHNNLAQVLSEELQQRVLQTKNIRLLSARMGQNAKQAMIPYLALEFSATWLIEAEIRDSNGNMKITLNLVDAQSAVVLDSVRQSFNPDKLEVAQFVDSFVIRMVQEAEHL